MSKAPKPAPVPDAKPAALATANSGKYDEVGPDGDVRWSLRPGADPNNPQPGDYIRTTTLTPQQQALRDKGLEISGQLGDYGQQMIGELGEDGDARQRLQDALYQRSTRYMGQDFDQQQADTQTRLSNQGLAPGSEAYEREVNQLGRQRSEAFGNAATTATIQAEQQSQSNQQAQMARLMQVLSMARGQTPQSGNSSGGAPVDFLGAQNQQYQNQVAATNASNAARAQQQSTLLGLGSLGVSMF
jgi:hypothetical protein